MCACVCFRVFSVSDGVAYERGAQVLREGRVRSVLRSRWKRSRCLPVWGERQRTVFEKHDVFALGITWFFVKDVGGNCSSFASMDILPH